MHKKQTINRGFDITDKNDIAELSQAFKDIENKFPIVFEFLESYCGFTSPLNTFDPHAICYSQGKRDVILTIKTMIREDISPEVIAGYYKERL